jgi:hypothetical protein
MNSLNIKQLRLQLWKKVSRAFVVEIFTSKGGVGPQGEIYLADSEMHLIRKVWPSGQWQVLAGSQRGYCDGQGPARFDDPSFLGLDRAGNCYVDDRGNGCIRKVSPLGYTVPLAGEDMPGEQTGRVLLTYRYIEWCIIDGRIYILQQEQEPRRFQLTIVRSPEIHGTLHSLPVNAEGSDRISVIGHEQLQEAVEEVEEVPQLVSY